MSPNTHIVFCLLLLLLGGCKSSFTLEKYDSADQLASAIKVQKAKDNIPGLSIITGQGSRILFELHLGSENFANGNKISDSTNYEWFSITKLFTAVAILNLQEDGLLNLNDPVSNYLDFFEPVYKSDASLPITVKHLLTHTSGLNDKEWKSATWFKTKKEIEGHPETEFVHNIFRKYRKLKYEPGSSYQYSNAGYVFLGEIVKKVSGIPPEEYIQDQIITPLQLNATFYEKPDTTYMHSAIGYEKSPSVMAFIYRFVSWRKGQKAGKENGYVRIAPLYTPHPGYIGLRGSASDLATFASLFSSGHKSTNILIESNIALMKQKYFQINETRWMGLGWQVLQDFHGEFIRHLGGGPGFKAEIRVYEDGTYIVILGNTSFDSWNYANLVVYNLEALQ